MVDPEASSGLSLRDYVAVANRRKWLIAAAAVVCLGLALGISLLRTPMYMSSATLLYQSQQDLSSLTSPSSSLSDSPIVADRNLSTSAKLFGSAEVTSRAIPLLNQAGPTRATYAVSATPITDASLLSVAARSSDAETAAAAANAYAKAFVAWRIDVTVAQIKNAEAIVAKKLAEYTTPQDRASSAFFYLTQRLADLKVMEAMEAAQGGGYAITQAASPAQHPYSPNHARDGAIGLAGGLLVGIVAAFVLEQLDVRVRDQDELVGVLKLPVLGRISQVPKGVVRSGELAVLADSDSVNAEAFRMLRGNLDFVSVDAPVRSMLVTSATAGEGKTSTVCNLAVTLARAGKRVIVVEADLRRPKVYYYFHVVNDIGISDVLADRVKLEAALKPIELPQVLGGEAGDSGNGDSPSLQVLTSGTLPPNPGEIVLSRRMGRVIGELADQADIVLVDSPPFLAVGDAAALANNVDGVLTVMKIGHVTRPILKDTRDFLATLPCKQLGIVVTNAAEARGVYRQRYYGRPYPQQMVPAIAVADAGPAAATTPPPAETP